MRKFLFFVLLLGGFIEAQALDLNGKFLSQSGELLFRFTTDSLYVDIAQSHRNVSSFKLIKKNESKKATTFNAYESYLENGHEMISTYYDVAPSIVKHIDLRPDSALIYEGIWKDHIRPCISLIEQGENEACARRYMAMVSELKDKYFLPS